MSDTLNHLPPSYPDPKSCLNIILRHLASVKIFSCGENLIQGKVGQIWHFLVLCGCWSLHLDSMRARLLYGMRARYAPGTCYVRARWTLCVPNARWTHRMHVKRYARAPKGLVLTFDVLCACRMASCAPG